MVANRALVTTAPQRRHAFDGWANISDGTPEILVDTIFASLVHFVPFLDFGLHELA